MRRRLLFLFAFSLSWPALAAPTSPSLAEEPFRLPYSVGTIVETHAPANAKRFVYHLQDVHDHYPAQVNMSEIVRRLGQYAKSQNKKLIVGIEANSGEFKVEFIANNPDQKEKEEMAAGYMRAGYFFGEEYAALTSEPGLIRIIGIEPQSLYKVNIKAREGSADARDLILLGIRDIREQLLTLKQHNFPQRLSLLEKKRVEVEAGTLPLTDYLVSLHVTDPVIVGKYPVVMQGVDIARMEQNINFNRVDQESRALVREVTANRPAPQAKELLEKSKDMREGRLPASTYYQELLAQSQKQYPTIRAYLTYLKQSEAIDPDRLMDDLVLVEDEIAQKLVKHPMALDLYHYSRFMELQERFFSLTLIPREWDKQKDVTLQSLFDTHTKIAAFINEQVIDLGYTFTTPIFSKQQWETAYRGARRFYLAADARNIGIMENLSKVMDRFPSSHYVTAYITGGFHTPMLTDIMKKWNWAYQVVRPQIETTIQLGDRYKYPMYRPMAGVPEDR